MKQFIKSPAFAKLYLFIFSLNLLHKIKGLGHISTTESTAFRVGYITSMLIIAGSIISLSTYLVQLRKNTKIQRLQ